MNAISPLDFIAPAIVAPGPDTLVHDVPRHGLSLGAFARMVLTLVNGTAPLPAELTQRQLAVLLRLGTAQGPHTVGALAATLGVCKPAITRAVDVLTAEGLVERVLNTRDRRIVFVVLTACGRAALRELAASLAADPAGA